MFVGTDLAFCQKSPVVDDVRFMKADVLMAADCEGRLRLPVTTR